MKMKETDIKVGSTYRNPRWSMPRTVTKLEAGNKFRGTADTVHYVHGDRTGHQTLAAFVKGTLQAEPPIRRPQLDCGHGSIKA